MASLALSSRRFLLSSEHLLVSEAYYLWACFNFSSNSIHNFSLPTSFTFFNCAVIALLLSSSSLCCFSICPSSSTSAANLSLPCCLHSLSLKAKLIYRVASFTFKLIFSSLCSICSIYYSPLRH